MKMDYIELWVNCKPTEYFCYHCRQLRLKPDGVPVRCGFCGNKDLKTGSVGSLNKQALIRKLNGLSE